MLAYMEQLSNNNIGTTGVKVIYVSTCTHRKLKRAALVLDLTLRELVEQAVTAYLLEMGSGLTEALLADVASDADAVRRGDRQSKRKKDRISRTIEPIDKFKNQSGIPNEDIEAMEAAGELARAKAVLKREEIIKKACPSGDVPRRRDPENARVDAEEVAWAEGVVARAEQEAGMV